MIYQSFKIRRQVKYEPKVETSRVMTSNIETSLNVGLGLYLHQKTRNKISVILCQILIYLSIMIKFEILRVILSSLLLKEQRKMEVFISLQVY